MKVLIAPDSFKHTMSAETVTRILAEEIRMLDDSVEVDDCPLADGGEGSLKCWASATGADILEIQAMDLFGQPVLCPVGREPGTRSFFLEVSHTCGFHPTSGGPDPFRASSAGLGMVLSRILELEPDADITVALGGSGTVDGGFGAFRSLGLRLVPDRNIRCVVDLPEELEFVWKNPFLRPPRFLCDVKNPLLGPFGAAAVFGPQKGVPADGIADFDRGLSRLIHAASRTANKPFAELPGMGSAGGIGALFAVLAHSPLVPGAAFLMEASRFAERMAAADLVLTGEGCFDATSMSGKLTGEIFLHCRQSGIPLLILAGRTHSFSGNPVPPGFLETLVAGDGPVPSGEQSEVLLRETARRVLPGFLQK